MSKKNLKRPLLLLILLGSAFWLYLTKTAEPMPVPQPKMGEISSKNTPKNGEKALFDEIDFEELDETFHNWAGEFIQPDPPEFSEKDFYQSYGLSVPEKALPKAPEPVYSPEPQFIKNKQRWTCEKNCLTTILNSQINGVLNQQLMPLQRLLEKEEIKWVEILYSDYQVDGKINPINSKILAIRSNLWTFFSRFNGSEVRYYDLNGQAPEKTMDRIPLKSAYRVSSGFSYARRHPITGNVRPHEGVDLVAPRGTPVYATAEGWVIFAGVQSGYGKLVKISHENDYETRYAHLDSYSVGEATYVTRGMMIGRLGNTGASTGAHLHYEVRILGVAYDPMKVNLPSGKPLPEGELSAWRYRANEYLRQLDE